jgi:hypothetical protein
MKNTTRFHVYLPMAAMILAAALAVPAAAQKRVPFQGALQGNDTDSPGPSPGTLGVATSGTGIGAHVGQFSFTQEGTLDLAALTATGSAHWIAANGDSIYTTFAGSGELTDTPGVFKNHGKSHHLLWHGSIRRSTRELYRGAPGKRDNVFDLRLIPREHYLPGCSSLRTKKRFRVELSDAISPSTWVSDRLKDFFGNFSSGRYWAILDGLFHYRPRLRPVEAMVVVRHGLASAMNAMELPPPVRQSKCIP